MRTLVAIDLPSLEFKVKEMGFKHFPLETFLDYLKDKEEFDVVETLVALQKRQPWEETDAAIIESQRNFESKKYALEMSGGTVITTQSNVHKSKQADTMHMVVKILSYCLRNSIEYLVLFANNGDYSFLVSELRANGIRTVLFAFDKMLANNLKRTVTEYHDAEKSLTEAHNAYGESGIKLVPLNWEQHREVYSDDSEEI